MDFKPNMPTIVSAVIATVIGYFLIQAYENHKAKKGGANV